MISDSTNKFDELMKTVDIELATSFYSDNWLDAPAFRLGSKEFTKMLPEGKSEKIIKIDKLTGVILENNEFQKTLSKSEIIYFYNVAKNRMQCDASLGLNTKFKSADKIIFRDTEWPLEALFTRLLLSNPYKRSIFYDCGLFNLEGRFNIIRESRLTMINLANEYELYSEGKIVFKKSGNSFNFYDKNLFIELCSPGRSSILKEIDDSFINKVIKKGYATEKSREKLEKFKGFLIYNAIKYETNALGNFRKLNQINREELIPLNDFDRCLFLYIQRLCNRDIRQFHLYKTENLVRQADLAQNIYLKSSKIPPKKLQAVYQYLMGEVDISALDLNPDTLLDLLKLVKMFDLAVSISNCIRLNKIELKRGSDEIREIIMKIANLLSNIAFSITSDINKASDLKFMLDFKNWTPKRVGLQARLCSVMMIKANSLPKHILSHKKSKLTAVRGTSCAGKSRSIIEFGQFVLNPDHPKYLLRMGKSISDQQLIHFEGCKVVFERCFDEIANSPIGLNKDKQFLPFVIDKRMLKLEDIKKYLIKPAKKRNVSIILDDYDVPLLTSINRMLTRIPEGKDPVQGVTCIKDGFKDARGYRKKIIKYAETKDRIEEYNLYYMGKLIAKKENGKIKIPKEYKFCVTEPSDKEIDEIFKKRIDDNYIRDALINGDIKEEDSGFLEQWKGRTVHFALEKHANGSF